jgi:aminoglycoside phosphotransferase family enzyme/predicted kinase
MDCELFDQNFAAGPAAVPGAHDFPIWFRRGRYSRSDVHGLINQGMDHVVESQEEVFALLANPATHGGHVVKRIDTHAAVVFLTRERVLKIKRAVRFPFLDFSTRDKRKAACEAEIEANRPFAPEIYRGVVAITREPDGRVALRGSGAPVEWAVEMQRFDESMTLDRLADEGRIDVALADRLGQVIAEAHERASAVDPSPWIEAIRDYIDEHETAFGELPEVFPAAEVEALAQEGRAAYVRIRPLLVERGERGFVRRIHGDLHLGNIVLIAGRPVLFDAIEFSALIASGDVLYDVAFLIMDLVERRLSVMANVVFNRYLFEGRSTENLEGLAALPFYLSMRAAIRAKVTAARLEQSDAEARPYIARQARTYFDWARRFIAPGKPVLVAVGGLSGTGKSVLARALAPQFAPSPGAVVLRSDAERKALFGKREDEALPPDAYLPDVTARVYCVILDKARRALAAGHSAILDAVFAKPQERFGAERSAAVLGIPFRGIFLETDLAMRLARVGAREADASDADAAIARAQESFDIGRLDWIRVDASEETLARVRSALGALSVR